jgi:hypothetical protein
MVIITRYKVHLLGTAVCFHLSVGGGGVVGLHKMADTTAAYKES